MNDSNMISLSRRRLLGVVTATSATAIVLPSEWAKPVINAVVLPAHAQTSICTADATVGGPLLGNPHGATNCADACAGEAADLGAQLCSVSESIDTSAAVICNCEVDLP